MRERVHLAAVAGLLAAGAGSTGPTAADTAFDRKVVVATYVEIGAAMYADAAGEARKLQKAVDAFLAQPSEAGLKAARTAWLAARVPYQQTEVFRFGNPIVDEWEGRVNA